LLSGPLVNDHATQGENCISAVAECYAVNAITAK